MDINKIVIREVTFIGSGKQTAKINFESGLNVICGASDTGKSFLIDSIDYLFGGKKLRDIKQRIGYEYVRIGIGTKNRGFWTFERSISGGNYNLYEGLIGDQILKENSGILLASHRAGKEDNISGWLLKEIGLDNKELRKNKSGDTISLSFRHLARLVIVNEEEIIRSDTPFQTAQYTTKTSEKSVFKLLLTGTDDSSLVSSSIDEVKETGINAKVELIEQWIHEVEDEISLQKSSKEELNEQLEKIENSLAEQRDILGTNQVHLKFVISQRRDVIIDKEQKLDRLNEIDDLIGRFQLLKQHYEVDIQRLESIKESGSMFIYEAELECPLCGSLPNDHKSEASCDGDVESIVVATSAEIKKINILLIDLQSTMGSMTDEYSRISENLLDLDKKYKEYDDYIKEEASPSLVGSQEKFTIFSDTKNSVISHLGYYLKLEKLVQQKKELLDSSDNSDEKSSEVKTELPKHSLNILSLILQKILKSWNFPGADSVYFDETTNDFVIDGKARGSRGKGLRAITHAAVTLALLEYCDEYSLPHPGFIVLDSPLLAYYKPEGSEDDLQGSDLKEKFYKYLIDNHSENQIIIIENEHPPEEFTDLLNLTVFTNNPHEGRLGLFPL